MEDEEKLNDDYFDANDWSHSGVSCIIGDLGGTDGLQKICCFKGGYKYQDA